MKRTYSKIGLSLAATLLAVSVSHASVVISAASVTPGLITTAKLADGAVTTPKINQDAVIEVKILDLNVTERKLADSAVTSSKLHAEALSPITLDKANGRVGIGTDNPSTILRIESLDTNNSIFRNGSSVNFYDQWRENATGIFSFKGSQPGFTGYLFLSDDAAPLFSIVDIGSVGIGTAAPGSTSTLHIAGGANNVGNVSITGKLQTSNETLLARDGGSVGIGTASPDSVLHISGIVPGTIGSHPAGQLIIQNSIDDVNSSVVIAGYESDGSGNPDQQLWYFGSSSGSNENITILNRRNADLTLGTNNSTRLTIVAGGDVGIGEAAPAARLEIKPQEATLFTLQSSSQNGTAIFTVDREGNLELNSRPITAGTIISTTSGSGFAHEMSGTYVVVLSTGVTVTAEPFFFCCQMTTTGGAGSETFFAQLRYDSTDIGPEWKRDTSSTDSGSLRAISGAQTLAAGHYQFKLQMKAATGGSTDIAGPAVCTIFQN